MTVPAVVQAFVLGRLHADLYPLQSGVTLDRVETFERFVGGFAGNVGIGLARLGVETAVISGVGDDGHGTFIRRVLAEEHVDDRWVITHPSLRTAITFAEIRPPDHFPLTAYRLPSCPDWEIRPDDLPLEEIARAPLLLVSGTALAQQPSRRTMLAAMVAHRDRASSAGGRSTILDLDWRPSYWTHPDAYPSSVAQAARLADTVIGSDSEFAAARLDPTRLVRRGVSRVYVKHGPNGASVIRADGTIEVPARPVEVINGLGSGDAFAAVVGWGVLGQEDDERVLRLANAAGAFVAARLACSTAMPYAAELEAFERQPFVDLNAAGG